ncbi:uncharacterized protein K444DRAFT_659690, partial [Hyaloscypha bicolor E]
MFDREREIFDREREMFDKEREMFDKEREMFEKEREMFDRERGRELEVRPNLIVRLIRHTFGLPPSLCVVTHIS